MKKRFRHYARHGWTLVEVGRANLYKLHEDDKEFGNGRHYIEMRSWCNNTFPKGSWEATLEKPYTGKKKFVFKDPKYATLFRMKWS